MTNGGQYASIDPVALKRACDSMQHTVEAARREVAALRPELLRRSLPTTGLMAMLRVTDSLEALLPGLRRRVAMAVEIDAQSPGLSRSGIVLVPGDGLGGFPDAHAAVVRARWLAGRISADGMSPEESGEISRHASDPDFAPAFVKALGAAGVARWLGQAWETAQPRGNGHAPGDDSGLVMWGELLATAGRHGLVFDRAWFVGLYSHSSSCDFQAPLKYVAAALARGSFSTESLVQIAAVVGLTGPELRQFDDESAADRLASQKAVLDALRGAHVPPASYRALLQEYWAGEATSAARIDPDGWDPANGVAGNRETINQVYEYYGRLFLAHPELRWAGMANLVGPGFAAGFLDLSTMRAIAREVASKIERANPLPAAGKVVAGAVIPGLGALEVDANFAETVAHMSDADLKFYETTFLKMQRDILRDMGGLQEAYLADPDGLTALRELASARIIKPAVMTAFEHIRDGRDQGHGEKTALLDEAAQALARREQFDVIGDSWDAMRKHPVDGEAMTYFMTVVGQPSIPGARSPGQVSPLHGTAHVRCLLSCLAHFRCLSGSRTSTSQHRRRCRTSTCLTETRDGDSFLLTRCRLR